MEVQPVSPCAALPASDATAVSGRRRYIRKEKIGEGSYGKVYKCVDIVTKEVVAIKDISWHSDEEGIPTTAVREVALLRELQHPNVVRLLDLVPEGSHLLLIFEYMEKDLKRLLDQRCTPVIDIKLKDMMYQLLSGLHLCHTRRIVHRDIKPNNILVSRDGRTVKLADFGLGRAFCIPLVTYTNEVMTLYYRAPEVLLGETHYLSSVDVWSMGCVFAELAIGKPLFAGDGQYMQLIAIFQVMGTPNECVWPGVSLLPHYNTEFPQWPSTLISQAVPTLDSNGLDLLEGMLRYDPKSRITAGQALHHPWFDDVREACEQRLQEQLAREKVGARA